MEVKMVPINKLKPHPKNPRVHPDSAIDKLEKSIQEFGWTNPALVSADGYILAGHARIKAAKKAGLTEVPAIYLPLKGARAEAYLIADNRLQDETSWDDEALKKLLLELAETGIDLELTGFDLPKIEELKDLGDFVGHDLGAERAGASPWERMAAEGKSGVIFHFGDITCRLPEDTYARFKGLISEKNVADRVNEVLLNAIQHSG